MPTHLQPIDYSKFGYESGWNTDLLSKALSYKQGRYDVGREKLQSYYNQLGGLGFDLAKKEDRLYFENRMKTLENEVRKKGMGDLGLAGVSEYIAGFVAQAADEKVQNGYAGTIAGRTIMNQAKKTLEKTPEKFSQLNLDYSLRYYNNWLNDRQVGSVYRGGSTYVPDMNSYMLETADKVIKSLEPNAYVKFNPLDGSEFTMYKENGEVLSSPRIRAALEATIMQDPNIAQQMQINGWGQFRGLNDAEFAALQPSFQNQINDYNKKIDSLKIQRLSAKGDARQSLENDIKLLENNRDSYRSNKRSELETQIYKDNFLNNMSKAFAYSKIKDKGFETYQEGLVKWKDRQEQQREDDKSKAEIIKFAYDKGRDAGVLFGTQVYGDKYSREDVERMLDTGIFSPTTGSAGQKPSDVLKKSLDADAITAITNLEQQQNNILSQIKDKRTYGLDKGFPKGLSATDDLEKELEKITKDDWDNLISNGKVSGSFDDFQNSLFQYKMAKNEYDIVSEIRNSSSDKIEDFVFEKLKDGETHTMDNGTQIQFDAKSQSYEITPKQTVQTVTPTIYGTTSPAYTTVRTGQKVYVNNDKELKEYLENQLWGTGKAQNSFVISDMFPEIDTNPIFEKEYGDIYGGSINDIELSVTDQMTAGMARELLNRVGYSNLNDNFKEKLNRGANLQENVIEGLISNFAKNRDDSKLLPVFEGMAFGTKNGEYYAKIGDVEQELPLNLLQGSYLGRKLLRAGLTINEEKKQNALQNYIVRGTSIGSSSTEKTTILTQNVQFNNGVIVPYTSNVVFEIYNIPGTDRQVKTFVEIIDENSGKPVQSKYLDNNFYTLYDAKEFVTLNDRNGTLLLNEYGVGFTLESLSEFLIQQKANEIEKKQGQR